MKLAIAFVSLLVVVIVTVIGIPILARVFGEAARRGEDTDNGEGDGGRDGRDEERRSNE